MSQRVLPPARVGPNGSNPEANNLDPPCPYGTSSSSTRRSSSGWWKVLMRGWPRFAKVRFKSWAGQQTAAEALPDRQLGVWPPNRDSSADGAVASVAAF